MDRSGDLDQFMPQFSNIYICIVWRNIYEHQIFKAQIEFSSKKNP